MDYALRCLFFLAKEPETTWISITELSQKSQVPKVFSAKIFQTFVKHGFVESQRGKSGGVRLKSRQITLAEVIRAIEPDFCFNKCLQKTFTCFLQDFCPIRALLQSLQTDFFDKLNKIPISELTQYASKEIS